MADADDDFTFPAAAAAPPFESPPLWRRPESDEFDETEGRFGLCPCCVDSDFEEKMDLLWEGLNEEGSRSCGKVLEDSESASPGRSVQICCVKTLKLSKANGDNTVSGLKESILVLIRFLVKKGLAMHSSRSSVKKLAW